MELVRKHKEALGVIISAQEDAMNAARGEIRSLDPGTKILRHLDANAQFIAIPLGYPALVAALSAHPPIFVRHLFPVLWELNCEATSSKSVSAQVSSELLACLDPGRSVSLQARHAPNAEEPAKIAVEELKALLADSNMVYETKNPEQIISLYSTAQAHYLGISTAEENLSSWNGGMQRFRRDDDLISRAEFKLLEALDTFSIQLAPGGLALDLGAAPGGWSKVLLDQGLKVIAIDPGALSDKLKGQRNLTHFRDVVQHYHGEQHVVDLIVNDMKMDPIASAEIMLSMLKYLNSGGQAIMTLKLPKAEWQQTIRKTLLVLQKGYTILKARQLFSNRSEITVYMTPHQE